MKWILGLITLGVGMLSPLKAGLDSKMAEHLNDAWAALVSLSVTLVLVVIVAIAAGQIKPPSVEQFAQAPWYLWLGGVCGLAFVGSGILIAPKLGAAYFIMLLVTGQIIAGLVLDHFGLLTFEQRSISWMRVLGAALVVGGVVMVQQG